VYIRYQITALCVMAIVSFAAERSKFS